MIGQALFQKLQEHPKYLLIEKCFPFLAFGGGFGWDSFTLGQVVKTMDLFVLSIYFVGSTILLLLLPKVSSKYSKKLLWGIQFSFGALFSALTILYFKSAGGIMGLLVVLGLGILLLANEFFFAKGSRQSVLLVMHLLIGMMYLNFLLPHLVHGVGFGWMLLSSLLAFGLTHLLWKNSGEAKAKVRYAMIIVLMVFVGAWYVNAIPPVPLVLKDGFAAVNRVNYSGQVEQISWFEEWTKKKQETPIGKDGKVWYFSSVFAPSEVKVDLEHRWWKETANGWQKTDVIPLRLGRGGREEGWRFYSNKGRGLLGDWKVQTALKNGPILGESSFRVVESSPRTLKKRDLP